MSRGSSETILACLVTAVTLSPIVIFTNRTACPQTVFFINSIVGILKGIVCRLARCAFSIDLVLAIGAGRDTVLATNESAILIISRICPLSALLSSNPYEE